MIVYLFLLLMCLVVSPLFMSLTLANIIPQAHKCLFLRYSHTQKGYRCYSPESRRYFVNVDVTFFESTSFFSSPGQSLYSNLISNSEGESSLSSPTLLIPLTSSLTPLTPSASLLNPPLQVYWRSWDRRVVSYSPDTRSSPSEHKLFKHKLQSSKRPNSSCQQNLKGTFSETYLYQIPHKVEHLHQFV
jgi:hypothetical protein